MARKSGCDIALELISRPGGATMASCKGCVLLQINGPCIDGDCWSAHCMDKDKPVLGERRVVAVSWAGPPAQVQRPAWCRRKKEANTMKTRETQSQHKTQVLFIQRRVPRG